MSNRKQHESLIGDFRKGAMLVRKFGLYGFFLQFGIIGFLSGWKNLEIKYYTTAAPVLISLSIYFLVKDFLTIRRIEEKISQLVLEGIELEKKNGGFEKSFHDVLRCFSLPMVLLRRSLVNGATFWCLGYLVYQFLNEVNPVFAVSHIILGLFALAFSALVCKLYYDSFQKLAKVQTQIFANS